MSQHWLRFSCSFKDSQDSKTISCHSPNQWHLLQTTFQTFEQVVGGLAARAAALEAGAASASSGSGSANSWNWDKAMAPQPLGASGPMAQGRLMTVEYEAQYFLMS